MNAYVQEMKKALSDFYSTMTRLNAQKEQNLSTYQSNVARDENEKLDKQINDVYRATWSRLQELHSAGIAQAERWGALDGSKITDDIKLLSGGFDLKKNQVAELVEKYRGNGTMMEAIGTYASSHNMSFLEVPTVTEKVKAWGVILAYAKDVMDQCTGARVGWVQGAGAVAMLKGLVEHFGTSDIPGSALFKAYQMVEQ